VNGVVRGFVKKGDSWLTRGNLLKLDGQNKKPLKETKSVLLLQVSMVTNLVISVPDLNLQLISASYLKRKTQ
jgi:hypothetical protein